jgi:putative thioredoxin
MTLLTDSSLPSTPPAAQAPPLASAESVDVTLATFAAEVIDASRSRLVLVDFWAPWCGPCKQLGPVLEKLVRDAKGAIKLTKVDIDKNQAIAAQMRVQSIPAVFAFWQGQPIDGFMGALPESQIKRWLEELIKVTGEATAAPEGQGLDAALAQAAALLEGGEAETAYSIFIDLLRESPDNADAFAGALRCLLALGQPEKAAAMLGGVAQALVRHKAVESVRAAVDLALQAKKADGTLEAYRARLGENPDDHQARYDLAMAHYASQDARAAMEELLEIISRDRKWMDDGARKQLLKFFEALGPMHADTIEMRKKLSTMLFS